ncbi:hypothetical protein COK07_29460 [Bacillus thuringiensis]|uniref:hypothetical protein n=1 Tax=Bacillus thuringiensis TaxID=1428 RepID=UPI000BF3D378|nr:hypothetical protein [Bacillus thuringiensis]PFP69927.1 hypothetical protein COK07_29460 [Bacillus thuringiensis]
MEVVVNSQNTTALIWDHFLLKETEVKINKYTISGPPVSEMMHKTRNGFRLEIEDSIVAIDVSLSTIFRHNGKEYPILKIIQRFNVKKDGMRAIGLVPTQWQKISPNQVKGISKLSSQAHPLLRVEGGVVTVAIEFVDITQLFFDIHGDTPWFSALELLKGTRRTVRVLAALQGHPFIWYVVIPDSVAANKELQPHLLYYPVDYGGISYPSDKVEGITTPIHNTTIGDIQCSGEMLFMFLTKPITDSNYDTNLEKYLALKDLYKNRKGKKLPPLHHFREVLSYNPEQKKLFPNIWEIPFGFEQAVYEKQQILLIPQLNNGDGGIAIKKNLFKLVENAIFFLYTQSSTLTYETVSVQKLILTCYSQSGGNVFTATSRNLSDIKAILCFEAQYMNRYLKGVDKNGRKWEEDKNLSLGKDVIPNLLRQGGKVAIIGRRKEQWRNKYLPDRIATADLILLPDDKHSFILDYPNPSTPYDPSASPVLVRRYSRLLKHKTDPIINKILTQESGVIDYKSAEREARVEEIIDKLRKEGHNDENIIKTVFTPELNQEAPGGYYTHNFIISSGQELTPDGQSVLKFFHQALNFIS